MLRRRIGTYSCFSRGGPAPPPPLSALGRMVDAAKTKCCTQEGGIPRRRGLGPFLGGDKNGACSLMCGR